MNAFNGGGIDSIIAQNLAKAGIDSSSLNLSGPTDPQVFRPKNDSGPVGGYMRPSPVYTPHTGFYMSGEEKIPTGGGQRIRVRTPQSELLAARPDLAGGSYTPPEQFAASPQAAAAPVKSVADPQAAARAQALRMANAQGGQ